MICTLTLHSPIGPLSITAEDNFITRLDFFPAEAEQPVPLLREAARQLEAYFDGRLRSFDLPLLPRGTAFQAQVWQILTEIPYGEIRSYGALAAALGKSGAARAVGMACNRNPLPLFIPCHRVVGASGQLTGYRGGLAAKSLLLNLETP